MMNKINNENNEIEKSDETGQKSCPTAIRISVIGGSVSFLFVLFAISTLFNGTDSAGPSFFILGSIAVAVLVVSGLIAVFISLTGIANCIIILIQNNDSAQNPINEIKRNISLIVGIIVAFLIVFKLLNTIW